MHKATRIAVLLTTLIVGIPAFADYKIEMVDGDSIIVRWYRLDRKNEVVLYQQ